MMSNDTPLDEQKSERFNMFMSPSEMKAIEEWAWANRIRSKSEAVRRLIQVGIRVNAAYPELKSFVDKAYAESLKADQIVDRAMQLPDNKGNELLSEAVRTLALIRSTVADVVIQTLHMRREMASFENQGDMEELISSAEAFRTEAQNYWEKTRKSVTPKKTKEKDE